ncbi:histidine kinase [Bengtsoniella intestinalis]|uniref:sensor histidine kinase n=1 Tax=Bengtsoniella intestinalis TaxID=3073143 RepID=UPI00391EF4A6
MIRRTLKRNLMLLFVAFLVSLFVIWGIFYLVVSRFIYDQTESTLNTSIIQITDQLSAEFTQLEQLCYTLQDNATLQAFFTTDDTMARIVLAGDLEAELQNQYNASFVSDVIAMDVDGDFYRLTGSFSNPSAQLLSRQLETLSLPSHITVSTQGELRLGYVVGIYDDAGSMLGYFLMLTSREKLYTLVQSYHLDSYLSVSLLSGDDVIINSGNFTDDTMTMEKQMGITPFSVVCSVNEDHLHTATQYFTMATIWTLILSGIALWGCILLLKTLFLQPMLHIIGNAKSIGHSATESQLSHTGQADFDGLVDEINHLIVQLEERTQATFALERAVHTTELERQTAIVASLKKQINAHFTVNTLAVIRGLNRQGETEKVAKLSDGLAHLLRYAYDGDESISCLSEVIVLEKYATMMQIRYPERFEPDFDIHYAIEERQIPRMLLQPILENAIIHGFSDHTGCHLTLWGEKIHKNLCFTITDDGCGMTSDKLKTLQDTIAAVTPTSHNPDGLKQIALANIQKRVVTEFGVGFGLTIQSTQGQGTTVTLTIPG